MSVAIGECRSDGSVQEVVGFLDGWRGVILFPKSNGKQAPPQTNAKAGSGSYNIDVTYLLDYKASIVIPRQSQATLHPTSSQHSTEQSRCEHVTSASTTPGSRRALTAPRPRPHPSVPRSCHISRLVGSHHAANAIIVYRGWRYEGPVDIRQMCAVPSSTCIAHICKHRSRFAGKMGAMLGGCMLASCSLRLAPYLIYRN